LLASKATFATIKSWTKLTAFITMLFFVSFTINSQCENTSLYPSAPTVAPTNGSATISTCNYLSEYSTISGVAAGTAYICDITMTGASTGYVTIRDAANSPVAHGPAPLSWVSGAAGDYTAHWNVDALCATATGCHTTSITYVGTGCTNTALYPTSPIVAPTSGTATISTCNYLSEYSGLNSVVGGTTYTLNITNAGATMGYITVRSGTSGGPLVALGNAPLTFTAPASGTYYAHWNVDSACATATGCHVTTMEFINSGGAQCNGLPSAGSASGPTTAVCAGFTVDASGASTELGVDYQWQSSTNLTAWADIAGATDTSYTGTQTVDTYYRMRVVCSNSNDTSYTNDWFIVMGSASTLPFFEDLETLTPVTAMTTTANCWTSDPGGATNLFDWNIDGAGSTPSSNTGPTAAYSGTNYFYTEASYGGVTSLADLYSPVIDLGTTPTTGMELKFFYHMFGATMGDLFVQVNDGSGWTTLDSLMGQQQTSATAPWEQRIVDISSYSGNIQVRFRADKGTSFTGDICLDDIAIEIDTCAYHQVTTTAGTSSVCEGDSIIMVASGAGTSSYLWSSLNDSNYVYQGQTAVATAGSINETFYVTVLDSAGCSATDSISIGVTPTATATIYLSTIDSVVVNSQTYNQTGIYIQTLQSAAGCDSLLTINVLITCVSNVNAGADQVICEGDSVTLTATASGGVLTQLSWSNGASTNTISVTPTATTSYIVTGVDSLNCTSSDTVDVVVNTLPFVNAGMDSSFCAGDSLQLSATAYGTGNSGTGTATVPAHSTPYSGFARGYYFTAPVNFQITEISVPTEASTGAMSFAVVKSTSGLFTTFDQLAYETNINGLTYTLPTPINVVAGETIGILGQRGTNANSYTTASSTHTILINGQTTGINRLGMQSELPITSPQAFGALITAVSGNSGRVNFSYTTGAPIATTIWSPSAGLNDSTITNPLCTASATTTYTLTVVDSNGCSANDDVLIAVNASSTVDAGLDQTLCQGDTVTLTATATPSSASYTWSNGATGAQNVFVASSTTTYTVTVVDSGYCGSTDDVIVTVNPVDTTISSATGNDSVVVNGQVYTQSGTYYQTVASALGCDSVLQIGVVVNCSSNILTSGNDTICEGGASVINTSGGSFSSYNWSNGQTSAIITVTPTATTTYIVTAIDSSGCTSVDTAIVTVNPNPVVDAGMDLQLCGQNPSDTIHASVVGGTSPSGKVLITELDPGGPDFVEIQNVGDLPVDVTGWKLITNANYNTWTINTVEQTLSGAMNPGDLIYFTDDTQDNYWGNNLMYNPGAGPTFTNFLLLLDASGNVMDFYCSGYDSSMISSGVITCSAGSYNVSNMWNGAGYDGIPSATQSNSRKDNGQVDTDSGLDWEVITSSKDVTNAGLSLPWNAAPIYTYLWSPSAGLDTNNVLTPECSVTTSSTYTLTVTDANGCSGSDAVNVTYGDLSVNAGPDLTICEGDTVNLSVGGDSTNTFFWLSYPTGGGTPNQWGTQQISDTPNDDVFYSVQVSDANGCYGWDTVNVVVNDVTNGTTSATGVDSVVVNGQVYTQTGTYTQTLTNAAGCDSILTVSVELTFTGIGDETIGFVNVYPNPTRGSVRITGLENLSGVVDIRIVDNRGRLIHQLDVKDTEVDLSSVTPGVYYLKISHAEGVGRIKLVKN
jgi:hypothetical protein